MKAQLLGIFARVLGPHQGVGIVDSASHRAASAESAAPRRASGPAGRRSPPRVSGRCRAIGGDQRLALGDVVGAVSFEAPAVQHHRQVIGIACRCRRNRNRSAPNLVLHEQHIVGKQIGMDDAAGQVARPVGAPARPARRRSASPDRPRSLSARVDRLRQRRQPAGPSALARVRAKPSPASCSRASAAPAAAQWRRPAGAATCR